MKSILLAVVLSMVAYSHAAQISVASGKIVKGTSNVFVFTLGTSWVAANTVTIKADRPLFEVSKTPSAGYVGVDKGGAKLAGATAGTNAAGDTISVVGTSGDATGTGAVTVTFTTGIGVIGAPGIYMFTVDTNNAGDTISNSFAVPVFEGADHLAMGMPAMATSNLKDTAPGA